MRARFETHCGVFMIKDILLHHHDLINSIAFNSRGDRFISCSNDHYVKVWNLISNDYWKNTSSWKAHHGIASKVKWAHTSFGPIIATCSSIDRSISIWTEINATSDNGPTWVKMTTFNETNDIVSDISFAPLRLGLLLAACFENGIIRVYKSEDITNLSRWSVKFSSHLLPGCSCLSWGDSLLIGSSCIAIGFTCHFSNMDNKNGSRISSYSKNVDLIQYKADVESWEKIETDPIISSLGNVCDLAFSPYTGRDYHLLAIAANTLHLYQIFSKNINNPQSGKIVAMLNYQKHVDVMRVSWNFSGTILTSSAQDGTIISHRQNTNGEWNCFFVLNGNTGDFSYPFSKCSDKDSQIRQASRLPISLW